MRWALVLRAGATAAAVRVILVEGAARRGAGHSGAAGHSAARRGVYVDEKVSRNLNVKPAMATSREDSTKCRGCCSVREVGSQMAAVCKDKAHGMICIKRILQ